MVRTVSEGSESPAPKFRVELSSERNRPSLPAAGGCGERTLLPRERTPQGGELLAVHWIQVQHATLTVAGSFLPLPLIELWRFIARATPNSTGKTTSEQSPRDAIDVLLQSESNTPTFITSCVVLSSGGGGAFGRLDRSGYWFRDGISSSMTVDSYDANRSRRDAPRTSQEIHYTLDFNMVENLDSPAPPESIQILQLRYWQLSVSGHMHGTIQPNTAGHCLFH